MSFIDKTAFQFRLTNNRYEDLQSITGQFGSVISETWTPADCSAGFACVKGDGIPEGGYKMLVASDGSADAIYFCNPTDVPRIAGHGGNLYAVGDELLGVGAPAGVKETYTKAIVDEVYAFGPGNFSTLVTTTNKYATISNGLLVGSSSEPDSGWYLELDSLLGIDVFTEANYAAFARYNMRVKYKAPVAPAPEVSQ